MSSVYVKLKLYHNVQLKLKIFQGDQDGGGGSDVGAFAGGLLGAIIKGVAKPPGAVRPETKTS